MSMMVDGTSAKWTLSNKGEKKLSIDACELKYRVLKKKKKTTFDEWGYAFTVRGLRGGSKTTRMQDLKRLAESKDEIESALREMTLFDTEMDSKIVQWINERCRAKSNDWWKRLRHRPEEFSMSKNESSFQYQNLAAVCGVRAHYHRSMA